MIIANIGQDELCGVNIMTNLLYVKCNVRDQNESSAFAVVVVNDEKLLSALSGLLSEAGPAS
jgi:hypothetical protein